MRLQFFDSAVIANSKLNYSGDVYVAYHMKRRVLFMARLLAFVKSFARLDSCVVGLFTPLFASDKPSKLVRGFWERDPNAVY